jgi:hypothetical protein
MVKPRWMSDEPLFRINHTVPEIVPTRDTGGVVLTTGVGATTPTEDGLGGDATRGVLAGESCFNLESQIAPKPIPTTPTHAATNIIHLLTPLLGCSFA